MQSNGDGDLQGNRTPACAACKHQRKKCNTDCELAPYFPATKAKQFSEVQSVFGISNVTKMLKKIPDVCRPIVAETLMWEAQCRHRDPIFGTYRLLHQVVAENLLLKEELKLCKSSNFVLNDNNNQGMNMAPLPPQQHQPFVDHQFQDVMLGYLRNNRELIVGQDFQRPTPLLTGLHHPVPPVPPPQMNMMNDGQLMPLPHPYQVDDFINYQEIEASLARYKS